MAQMARNEGRIEPLGSRGASQMQPPVGPYWPADGSRKVVMPLELDAATGRRRS